VSGEPPVVSCIVPVYNGERYLAEALESILGQTYRPVEVIVVDDGSTDGTAAVLAAYGQRITCLHQTNAGHAAARNRGLAVARGEFLAFLDADDLWHPEKLALQMARFQARPELDASITQVQNFWMPELDAEAAYFRDQRRGGPLPGYSPVTLLASRGLFSRIGPFNAALRHGADTDWFLRATEQGAVVELLPRVLVYRRLHASNFSRGRVATSHDEYLQIVKTALDRRRTGEASSPRIEGPS
jgi:glycosyltransferase involved in cell wall biosynthesis